ncbi:MAG: SgcJ/EcaC family oxidoreductase [Planctomycetes bacterium]|nr:SgcJ/EcaC family oxidoreductase [Planctomycetota bacterium]
MRICATLLLAAAVLVVGTSVEAAQPPRPYPGEEAAILKRAEAFVEAFHKGDAKAIAAFWTPDGDYTDISGKRVAGHETLEKWFATFFADNKGAKLRIDIESLRFVTPEVAIEDGVTSVMVPDGGPPSRAKYTVVHVKKDGKWHLSSVRDTVYTPPSNHEHLKGLEAFVGSWASDHDAGEVARVSFGWTENQNFMTSTFATTFKNVTVGGGTQWIGWDPANKAVRSWSFHANGGFGEGIWSRQQNTWIIKTTATLPDGKKATATDIFTLVDADIITFQAKERTVDGKPLPDVKEVKLKRVK